MKKHQQRRDASSGRKTGKGLTGRRLRMFRLATVCFAFLLLLLLETALRVFGYGVAMDFTVRREIDGRRMILGNPHFSLKYFEPHLARRPVPFCVPAVKPSGTCRIFVLGESAAQGFPEPAFSMARFLEVMLRHQYPATRFEVINACVTAINSHVILDIARECAGLEADLFVVYAGNNEVVGPYGPGTIFDSPCPRFLIRVKTAARSTRTGQLLLNAGRRLSAGRSGGSQAWRGMEMFVRQRVPASDPRLEVTYRNFEENLRALCRVAERSRIPVVMGTVAVNLKDCAPFASMHRAGLPDAALRRWEDLYAQGRALEQHEDLPAAVSRYEEARAIDGEYADLAFRIAFCRRAMSEFGKARDMYERARDLDALRFRADRTINEIVRRVAADAPPGRVRLADIENALSEHGPDGIPGREHFYEHVHFRFPGNYLAARVLLEQVRELLPEGVKNRSPSRPVVSEEECANALAFTSLDALKGVTGIMDMIKYAPFDSQADHAQTLAHLQGEEAFIRGAMTTNSMEGVLAAYENVLQSGDADWSLRFRYARILVDDAGNPAGAEKVCRDLLRETPRDMGVLATLGWAIVLQGRAQDGLRYLQAALALNPHDTAVHNCTGVALDALGRTEEAIGHYREALRLDPHYAFAHGNLGKHLAGQGRTEEAVRHYREALRINPRFAQAHFNWAMLLTDQGRTDEAVRHYREALRINPDYAAAHNNCALLLTDQGRTDEAIDHYREALRINPDYALAHNNWGYALACRDKVDDAIGHYREALRIEPGLAIARVNLRDALLRRAAACAEEGFFPEAVHAAREAAGLCDTERDKERDKELADLIAKRIAAYEAGEPHP